MKGRKENKMSEQIRVDDSLRTYDLVNGAGELLCQISFNPSDVNILKRHAEIQKSLEGLKLSLKDSSGENTAEEFINEARLKQTVTGKNIFEVL